MFVLISYCHLMCGLLVSSKCKQYIKYFIRKSKKYVDRCEYRNQVNELNLYLIMKVQLDLNFSLSIPNCY